MYDQDLAQHAADIKGVRLTYDQELAQHAADIKGVRVIVMVSKCSNHI